VPSGQNVALAPNQPVFLKYKNIVVGFDFIQATDDTCKPISPVFYRDGDIYKASRISWTHAASTPVGEAHVVFWAKVAENLDEAGFAKFREEFSKTPVDCHLANNTLQASVKAGPNSTLSLEANISSGVKKTSMAQPPGILQVNGKEIGQLIMGPPTNASPTQSAPK